MELSESVQLARLLGTVAGDLDKRNYPMAGVVRRAARALLALPEPTDNGCQGCGAELDQPKTGGRRRWCSEKCRRRHRR